MITQQVVDEATAWNTKHHKPVLMSEYGADTVEGLHLVIRFEPISILIRICSYEFALTFVVASIRMVRGISTGIVLQTL